MGSEGAVLPVISVPDAYGMVEVGVYRAAALKPHHLPFILRLNVRTVLHLSADVPAPAVQEFLEKNSIKLIHLGARAGKRMSWKPLNEDLIKDALEIVLDATNHPVIITCATGIRQTGTIVGCIRRLQKWYLTSVIEEYRRYAGNKAQYANEQLLELFEEDLVALPNHLPTWFVHQQKMMEEEMQDFLLQSEKHECHTEEELNNLSTPSDDLKALSVQSH